jgi:hypothetical protein
MKSMKMSVSEPSKELASEIEKPEYPYGLRICLSEEVLSLLGIKEMPAVGTKMKIEAMADVCSVSEYKTKDGEKRTLDLQITDMDLLGKSKIDASKMYPDVREEKAEGK